MGEQGSVLLRFEISIKQKVSRGEKAKSLVKVITVASGIFDNKTSQILEQIKLIDIVKYYPKFLGESGMFNVGLMAQQFIDDLRELYKVRIAEEVDEFIQDAHVSENDQVQLVVKDKEIDKVLFEKASNLADSKEAIIKDMGKAINNDFSRRADIISDEIMKKLNLHNLSYENNNMVHNSAIIEVW